MRMLKTLASTLLVLALLVCFSVPVLAAGVDVQTSVNGSAEWLMEQVPTPTIGDEDVVLALLRGSYATGIQEYTQGYLRQLKAHIDGGGAATQTYAASARQALVAAAAGVDIKAELPKLLNALNDTNALNEGGADAQRGALLLFGTSPVLAQQSKLDLTGLATSLAATAGEDGGFGAGGASDPITTARTMQALAAWKNATGVEDALLYGEMYLQLRTNDFGGFDVDGSASALAVAEAILAMDCLGFDPNMLGPESAPLIDALAVFQNQDGSFSADPDTPADAALTAVCSMALTAKLRYDRQKTRVFDFSDVTSVTAISKEPVASGAEASGATTPGSATTPTGSSGVPGWLIAAILAGVALLIVLLAVLFSKRTKQKKSPQKSPARKNPPPKSQPEKNPPQKNPPPKSTPPKGKAKKPPKKKTYYRK